MAIIKSGAGANVNGLKVTGNHVVGGDEVDFIEVGNDAKITDVDASGNQHITTDALKILALLKKSGESKDSAIKKLLTGMGHVANGGAIAEMLSLAWSSL